MSVAPGLVRAPRARPPRDGAPATATRPPRSRGRLLAGLTVLVLAGLAVWSLAALDISIPSILASSGNAQRFIGRVGALEFPPLDELLQATALTLGIVITGTVLAAVLSVPIAWLAAANTSPGAGWRWLGRALGVTTRAMPDVVLAMVFALLFSLGALPGILAIGIHSIGMISKLFADAIEQIDEGPRVAIRAAGGSKLQEFVSGIVPQVWPSWVATVLHRGDINLRGSVVLGYVGVAGLGMDMGFAFKSLNYGKGLAIAVVIFALCVLTEILSSTIRRALLVPGSSRIPNRVWGWGATAVIIAAVVACNINWGDFTTVWAKIPHVAGQFWPPSFGHLAGEQVFGAMVETVAIALAATLLAFGGSLLIGSFAARNVAPTRGVRTTARGLLVVVRGVPELILAIVLIVVTGLGSQAGVLALAFGGVGLLGKLIADSFEEVRRGPERALDAAGATRLQRYTAATLPQGVPALVGHTLYLLDTNIRAATILGVVGGGGVGYYLLNASEGARYQVVTAIVLLIFVTVLAVEGIAMGLRRAFR